MKACENGTKYSGSSTEVIRREGSRTLSKKEFCRRGRQAFCDSFASVHEISRLVSSRHTLFEIVRCDTDKLRLSLEFFDITRTAVGETTTDSSQEILNE